MIIKGYTKIVFNSEGEPIWGTNTLMDPQENINIVKDSSLMKSSVLHEMRSVRRMGRAAVEARQHEGWIWRQL